MTPGQSHLGHQHCPRPRAVTRQDDASQSKVKFYWNAVTPIHLSPMAAFQL